MNKLIQLSVTHKTRPSRANADRAQPHPLLSKQVYKIKMAEQEIPVIKNEAVPPVNPVDVELPRYAELISIPEFKQNLTKCVGKYIADTGTTAFFFGRTSGADYDSAL